MSFIDKSEYDRRMLIHYNGSPLIFLIGRVLPVMEIPSKLQRLCIHLKAHAFAVKNRCIWSNSLCAHKTQSVMAETTETREPHIRSSLTLIVSVERLQCPV